MGRYVYVSIGPHDPGMALPSHWGVTCLEVILFRSDHRFVRDEFQALELLLDDRSPSGSQSVP